MRSLPSHHLFAAAALGALLSLSAAAQRPPSSTDPDSYSEGTRRADPWFKKQAKGAIPADQRIVRVVVRDAAGKPVARANVAMKDLATGKVDTRQTLETGEYIFEGLKRTADYEFTAEFGGKSSQPRKVSQYLPNQAVSFDLKLGEPPSKEAAKPEPKKSAAK